MKLLASLQNRIFLASALVAVLSIAFATRFVTGRVGAQAEMELRRGLREAGALVEQHHAARLETLALLARLIADLPKLKAAVATGDPPTVEPIALDYKSRVGSKIFAVTDRGGRVLVALGAPGPVVEAAVQSALRGREATTFRPEGDDLLEIVTVPIAIGQEVPETLGTLSLGFTLDEALAAQFKAMTESEVAFALGGKIRASTLPPTAAPALVRLLGQEGVVSIAIGESEYVALCRPLTAPAAASEIPVALILRSRTERLSFLRTFRTVLAAAALVAVLMAVLLSYVVARTVTRPLAAITATMREMAATGDLTRKIRLGRAWDDEDARLLAGTFNTLTDSIARFQGEAALKERLSVLGRLSTVVAHEIRNPLMIIKSALRTLRRGGPPESAEALADIDHEVERLNRVVGDVLDFARPVRLEYAPTDVNALCQDAASATLAGDGSPRFTLSFDPALSPVMTDGDRLRTVLVNVLSNARDAVLERGEPTGEGPDVELGTEALPGGRVAIAVRDRGRGIDPQDLPHLFDPYFTTKRTGTGLGLAIAKNIVDSLGGTILATSVVSEGTEVRIELPPAPSS